MPRRGSNNSSTADSVQIPVIPGLKKKGRPRGKPMAKGDDPRRNKETLFQPGNRVNPGGQPKGLKQIREEFMDKVPPVLTALYVSVMGGLKDPNDPNGKRRHPLSAAQVSAAKEFLDRITGKAPQPITGADIERDLGDGELLTTLEKLAKAGKGEAKALLKQRTDEAAEDDEDEVPHRGRQAEEEP